MERRTVLLNLVDLYRLDLYRLDLYRLLFLARGVLLKVFSTFETGGVVI